MHSHCAHAKEVMSCGWRARCGVERTVARHHPFRKVDIQKVALQEPARTRVHEILVVPVVCLSFFQSASLFEISLSALRTSAGLRSTTVKPHISQRSLKALFFFASAAMLTMALRREVQRAPRRS